jgi:hypothetical protein
VGSATKHKILRHLERQDYPVIDLDEDDMPLKKLVNHRQALAFLSKIGSGPLSEETMDTLLSYLSYGDAII